MSGETRPDCEVLVSQVRAGATPDLGLLLERFRAYLTLLARVQIGRRLRGKVDGADLVQETFLQAYRCFDQFQGSTEAELAAWLRQILASRLAKLVRHYLGTGRRDLRLERELTGELDQSSQKIEQAIFSRQSSPSQQAVRREQGLLLADALGRLPEAYREVIILSHLEGLSFAEVSLRMGRTIGSVKHLWARALVRLRQVLEVAP